MLRRGERDAQENCSANEVVFLGLNRINSPLVDHLGETLNVAATQIILLGQFVLFRLEAQTAIIRSREHVPHNIDITYRMIIDRESCVESDVALFVVFRSCRPFGCGLNKLTLRGVVIGFVAAENIQQRS
jgi:hypothetical protein